MDGCFGAKVPWCGALVTWFLGAMAPQCLGDMKPWFRGAMVHDPMGHGALVHGAVVPIVRTISELVVQRAGKALEGTVPSSSTGQHMATHSHCKSSSRSPPKTNGFGTGTPCPGLIANPLP
ncbi:hypothetical protein T459_16097 [Capsicum annuum]|uniref:Uncharacterized protein n=1 Tax=Capsicum annuum TaxID=4072 RepID=A0A2G2Z852_CAPAN|nr:hypothetical protein T459_16097 [Capsicum annuum]